MDTMHGNGALCYSSVERSHESYILREPAAKQYAGFFILLIGIIWTLSTGGMVYGIVQDGLNFVTLLPLLFVSLFVFLGILIMVGSYVEIWHESKVRPPELIMPTYPLMLGQTVNVHYRRKLRKGKFRSTARIKAELVCDEWMQYSQDNDTVTQKHTLWKQILPEQTIESGNSQADYSVDIHIKEQSPPSFGAWHNKVRYRLIIWLHAPHSSTAYSSEFLLKVVPEYIA